MRLWHKDLISVLPRKQLLAQWRECCAIASNIANKGTPNHLLVNKMLDYSQVHFTLYVNMILDEMKRRSYKMSERSYLTLCENFRKGSQYFSQGKSLILNKNIYEDWMNDRYLLQCYCNLQEKHDCGGITDEEWNKIAFSEVIKNLLGNIDHVIYWA
jgi:uncharacterized protein (TIGR02328 family)